MENTSISEFQTNKAVICDKWEALILGATQDGGIPHMACQCHNCASAAAHNTPKYAVCLAVIKTTKSKSLEGPSEAWLVDCGPDIKAQWRMLQEHAPGCIVKGIFLTHLHMWEPLDHKFCCKSK